MVMEDFGTFDATAVVQRNHNRRLLVLAASMALGIALIAIVAVSLNSSSDPVRHCCAIIEIPQEQTEELFGPLSFDEVHTHILNMRMRRSQLKEKLKEAAMKRRERRLMARARAARLQQAQAKTQKAAAPAPAPSANTNTPQNAQLQSAIGGLYSAKGPAAPHNQELQQQQQPVQQEAQYTQQEAQPQYQQQYQPQPQYQQQQQQQQQQYQPQPQYQQQQQYQPQPQYQQQQQQYQPQPQYQQQYLQPQQQYQPQPQYQQQQFSPQGGQQVNWAPSQQLAQQQHAQDNKPAQLRVSKRPRDSVAGKVQERSMAASSERAYEAFVSGKGGPPAHKHHSRMPSPPE